MPTQKVAQIITLVVSKSRTVPSNPYKHLICRYASEAGKVAYQTEQNSVKYFIITWPHATDVVIKFLDGKTWDVFHCVLNCVAPITPDDKFAVFDGHFLQLVLVPAITSHLPKHILLIVEVLDNFINWTVANVMDLSDAHTNAYMEYAQITKLIPKVFNPIMLVTDTFFDNLNELLEIFDTKPETSQRYRLVGSALRKLPEVECLLCDITLAQCNKSTVEVGLHQLASTLAEVKEVCGATYADHETSIPAVTLENVLTALGHLKMLMVEMGKSFNTSIEQEMLLLSKGIGGVISTQCCHRGEAEAPDVTVLQNGQKVLCEASTMWPEEDFTEFQTQLGSALRSLSATKDLDDFVSVLTRMQQQRLEFGKDLCSEFLKFVEPIIIDKLTDDNLKMFKIGFLCSTFSC